MEKSIAVVGGDLRIVKLIEMLIKDGYKVYTYALENSEDLLMLDNVEMCPTLEETLSYSKVVVGPVPLSSDRKRVSSPFGRNIVELDEFIEAMNGKYLIAGNVTIKDELDLNNVQFTDLFKREEFSVLNTIATAEGTIQIAMEETQRTIHGSNVLVMGFGRIGKVLAKMLDGIGAKVYCEARKNEDISWIKAYGYNPIHLNDLNDHLDKFDIIINTIPFQILTGDRLDLVKKDTVIVDLASNPGGVDRKAARERNLRVIWALSLPAKVAPLTSAEFIKETIYHVLKEL
ncbi:MAG: dipicolinate synthase subunit DpsA [Clostridia bacterium]|nr:dipicolinate synthase subunit DpsA [Clostridia bacterium]